MLTIAAVAAAGAIVNAILPVLSRSSGAVVTASAKVDEQLKSDISIVHAVGELDSAGSFSDTNGNALFDIFIWVKNIGDTRIFSIPNTDLFVGKTGDFARISHETELEAGVYPRWGHSIEGGESTSEWGPKDTLKITVTYGSTQTQGNYDVKVVIPNGISDEYFFSM